MNIGEDEETQKASITEREGVRYLPTALLPGMLFVFQATSQRGSMHADIAGFYVAAHYSTGSVIPFHSSRDRKSGCREEDGVKPLSSEHLNLHGQHLAFRSHPRHMATFHARCLSCRYK